MINHRQRRSFRQRPDRLRDRPLGGTDWFVERWIARLMEWYLAPSRANATRADNDQCRW
jgi:hypothetical protein